MSHGTSQPPQPYDRQYSFTNWSITHPGEPHQGDKIDLELNEVKQSLDETQARLALIQKDDGHIRPSALNQGIEQLVQDAAVAAAEQTYADNLASVADKVDAQNNLLLPQHYAQINGDNLVIYSDAHQTPAFPSATAGHVSQGSQVGYAWPGLLATSTYTSRQFRSSVLFGTLRDYATDWADTGGSSVPDVTQRVDNVSMALLYAGLPGEFNGVAYPGWVSMAGYLQGDYQKLANMPSIGNPLVSCYMLKDAIQTHNATYDHTRIPSISQKAALNAATSASESNRFATMADISGGGSLTTAQAAAISGASNPSASNVFVTTSVLDSQLDAIDGELANKATLTHYHTVAEVTDVNGLFSLEGMLLEKADVTYVDTAVAGKADAMHAHATADVTGLDAALADKADATAPGIAKAWVSFDGTTSPPTIKASHNVASVTRSATGTYVVTFTSAFVDANYCWTGSACGPAASFYVVYQGTAGNSQSASAITVMSSSASGPTNCPLVNLAFHR